MQAVTTIGLDIAKSVFQVHGVDAEGKAVIRRQLKRRYVLAFFQKLPSCLVGIEACASPHHWSRELQTLGREPWTRQGCSGELDHWPVTLRCLTGLGLWLRDGTAFLGHILQRSSMGLKIQER
jgi:transposase